MQDHGVHLSDTYSRYFYKSEELANWKQAAENEKELFAREEPEKEAEEKKEEENDPEKEAADLRWAEAQALMSKFVP